MKQYTLTITEAERALLDSALQSHDAAMEHYLASRANNPKIHESRAAIRNMALRIKALEPIPEDMMPADKMTLVKNPDGTVAVILPDDPGAKGKLQ